MCFEYVYFIRGIHTITRYTKIPVVLFTVATTTPTKGGGLRVTNPADLKKRQPPLRGQNGHASPGPGSANQSPAQRRHHTVTFGGMDLEMTNKNVGKGDILVVCIWLGSAMFINWQ